MMVYGDADYNKTKERHFANKHCDRVSISCDQNYWTLRAVTIINGLFS